MYFYSIIGGNPTIPETAIVNLINEIIREKRMLYLKLLTYV